MNIKNLINKEAPTTSVVKVNKQTVKVKTRITAADFVSYVGTVANSVYDDDGNYNGAYETIVTVYANIKYLTDIEIDDLEADEVFNYANYEWYGRVMQELIKTDYYGELQLAVARTIKNNTRNSFDELCKSLTAGVQSLTDTDMISSLQALANKLNAADNKEIVRAMAEQAAEAK